MLNYELVSIVLGEYVVIRDTNQNISITNSAEVVVRDLFRNFIKGDEKIYYFDTEGELDELMHYNGEFTGFNFLTQNERAEIITKIGKRIAKSV